MYRCYDEFSEMKFNMGTLLDIELEFRTSELNGIILSVSEPQGYPALSLELHDGKVRNFYESVFDFIIIQLISN